MDTMIWIIIAVILFVILAGVTKAILRIAFSLAAVAAVIFFIWQLISSM
ncbi:MULTISPECIES: hypothetical protein [Shouchella]|uniref:Uncharacterized protein n=2 Tax=Shouchella TaxID=2893057 RepID=A0ABY7W2H8_9BACI|nr:MULTISPECIES: hypothetical protein [Shouchella]MED4127666.1 hypothetical protein [Shouchella miscanthi]WDF02649.1 hypothetical protein PQ477_14125 [Shouchella hunanensis]